MPYTIGACGFSGTGSSVVTDYLKEFDDILVKDRFEFTLAYTPDGLNDLRYHLLERPIKHHSYCYINRFKKLKNRLIGRELKRATNGRYTNITKNYITDITMAKWSSSLTMPEDRMRTFLSRVMRKSQGYSVISFCEEKLGHELNIYPIKPVNYSSQLSNFDDITQKYISDILCAMGWDKKKNIALDQPFAGNNPQISFSFFENPRAVVVDRDPRDYYLFYKMFLYKKGWRQIPVFDLEGYIKYYRNMRDNMPYKENCPNIMRVNFEELIYDYDNTTKRLREFCGVNEHVRPRMYFDPARSINNTQLFKRFPQYANEVKLIEDNLTEYLFPYEKYADVKFKFGKMFTQ